MISSNLWTLTYSEKSLRQGKFAGIEMMETSTHLRDFVSELLQREGAVVEPLGPDGLQVLAPVHVQQALRIADLERLGFGTDAPAGAQPVGLESDWLERLGQLLAQRGTSARCVVQIPAPPLTRPERVVEHSVFLQNAVYDFLGVSHAWTRYFIFLFRYTAYSDEKRDGLVKLGLNTANGAVLNEAAAHALLLAATTEELLQPFPPPATELPPHWTTERLNRWLRSALPERVRLHLTPFVRGLQRRLDRDLARVHNYYNELKQESLLRLQKRNGEARDRLRLEAIEREYLAKVEDLRQKYGVRVEVALSQTLEIIMPVQRFELSIKRRKAQRRMLLDWNPLLRKLDVLPCEHGFTEDAARIVCDDKLHLVSPAAHGPCANCQRAYCRACHPRKCPKCDQVADKA